MNKLLFWWQSLTLPWRRWRIVGTVAMADEIPDRLPDKGVILVTAQRGTTWAAFDCPCREGHRILVNLDRNRIPFWSIETLKPLTILPSIDDITPSRRCHFFLRNGRIKWTHHHRRLTG